MFVTRAELKSWARAQLGGGIFKDAWLTALAVCLISSVIISGAGAILTGIGSVLVSGPLSCGVAALFLKQSRDGQPMNILDVFQGFTGDLGNTLLLGLMTWLFTLLWGLLLVIPGIVKGYAYALGPYVKADHPEYDWRACLDESIRLMNGYKMELFLLDLSFLGWYIVGALCLGLGTLWVIPYHTAARTHFYNALLRARAQ